ncbi:MAG TPA: multiheme c-type cytochrome [Planctomycetota bacterium]|nr:multiheme c-type cytochrome [Planctomycetota bacterium]
MKAPPYLLAILSVASLLIAAVVSSVAQAQEPVPAAQPTDPHLDMLIQAQTADENAELRFPGARTCGSCHKAIYEEWSTSQHAYASISPMFHKFEQALNRLASGTVGAFCVRCHASAGTSMGELRDIQIYDRPEVSREGVTCITCHRVNENFMKTNGVRGLIEASLSGPVFGPTHSAAKPSQYEDIVADRQLDPSMIHAKATPNDQLSRSEFCMSCHQVAVYPGIKLEVVWDQYKGSPAHKRGVTCQDCHMGKVIGDKVDGDNWMKAPTATIGRKQFNPDAKHTDHSFPGPGYSIAHPGIFPEPRDSSQYSVAEWLAFDWREWMKTDFEERLAKNEITPVFVSTPPPGQGTREEQQLSFDWSDRAKRDHARGVLQDNMERIKVRSEKRRHLMESGSHIDGPYFDSERRASQNLAFHYEISNISDGHNFPSGSLGAQPEIWLNVALLAKDGSGEWKNIWESGFVDSHGDMADLHSHDVLEGKIEPDSQLFNLQTKFLTTNLKGTDREMYLPVPFDGDQLPFIRPAGVPTTVLNHPPFIRMEQRSIPPLSSRTAKYKVPGELIAAPGTYRLAVRLCSRAEPMYFMELVGATGEMLKAINEQMIDIHPYTVEFTVE